MQRPLFAPSRLDASDDARRRSAAATCCSCSAARSRSPSSLAVLTRSTPFSLLHLLADAALAGYVYLLVQYQAPGAGAAHQGPVPRARRTSAPAPYLLDGQYRFGIERVRTAPRLVPLRQTASN